MIFEGLSNRTFFMFTLYEAYFILKCKFRQIMEKSKHFSQHSNVLFSSNFRGLRQDLFLYHLLCVWIQEAKHYKILFSLFIIANPMIKNSSFQKIFTNFGFNFDQLIIANNGINIIIQFFIRFSF